MNSAVIPPAPRWTWGVALAALACTLALFLAVPLLETLRNLQPDLLQPVRALPDLRDAPPPPPLVLPEVTSPQPVAEAVPVPELSLPAPPPPLALTPSLSMPAVFTPAQWSTDPLRAAAAPLMPSVPALLDISQVDQAPRPRSQLRPLYPPRARLHRIEGWVDLEFTVTREGNVTDIEVIGYEPDESFSRNAVQAAARWSFLPARVRNEPVPVRVRQRITFELQ